MSGVGGEEPGPRASRDPLATRESARGLRRLLEVGGEALLRLPRAVVVVLIVAWLGMISWLSSWPAQGVPSFGATAVTTNLGHAFLFGMLGLWCALLVPRTATRERVPGSAAAGPDRSPWPRLDRPVRIGLVVLVALLGLVDEAHQHLAHRGRDFSLFDVVTDVTGAWCVLVIALYLRRPEASDRGLAVRMFGCLLACLAAAGVATWGPRVWPGVGWL